MSTHELYSVPVEHATWDVEMQGASRFTWENDDGRDRLLSLYQKGKDKQWDQVHRIDWDIDVEPADDVRVVADVVTRLTVSHLVLPGGRPDEVAADLARLVERLLPTGGPT